MSQETCQALETEYAVGCDGEEMMMTTTTQTRSSLRFVPAFFAAMLGLAVIALTGHVQAAALHDAAHDVRHATGFPCH